MNEQAKYEVPPPVPDPTVLTTSQLLRVTGSLRDYIDGKMEVLETRLFAIDRATELLNETVNRVPTETQTAIGRIQDLMDEKFKSIEVQFRERDTRQERESRDNKVAVDAAFAAQKEAAAKQDESNAKAIDKSERATAETILKVQDLAKTQNDAMRDKYDELKDRINRADGKGEGRHDVWGFVFGGVGMLTAVITLIFYFAR